MAALVLVVAAVMVGTFASGAHADGTVDLVNICNDDAFVYFGQNVTGILVEAGQTVGLNLTEIQGIIGPVYFQVNGTLYVITAAEVDQIIGTTGVLYAIQIICDGSCGEGILTITAYIQVYADGEPVGPPLNPTVCADVVVPGP
jgi:hypothetical protein